MHFARSGQNELELHVAGTIHLAALNGHNDADADEEKEGFFCRRQPLNHIKLELF